MSRIGITGHSNIAPESVAVVTDAIREVLRGKAGDSLTGVTCLARGADQIFARVVIELGGTVEVVLPAHDYRERVVKPENAAQFDELIEHERYSQLLPAKW